MEYNGEVQFSDGNGEVQFLEDIMVKYSFKIGVVNTSGNRVVNTA